jgi:hypothetical protein
MAGTFFSDIPAWFTFCASAVFFFCCGEAGFLIGRFLRERRPESESGSGGLVTGSILGLVSFLLAFSFGIAASNYSERRGAVLDEANAIGTAFLRADLLENAENRAALKSMLMEYTSIRVAVVETKAGISQYFAAIHASEDLHKDMWSLVSGLARDAPTPTIALVVASINEVIDLHSVRVAVGVRYAIPDVIWFALFAISAVALAATGYRFGATHNMRSELLPGMVFAFTCVVTLIADLDNPQHGYLLSDQTPMQDLLASMKAAQES